MKSFLIFLLLSSVSAFCSAAGSYTVEIHKSDRIMILKKDHLLKKTYHIATGTGGAGTKVKLGDKMTPTGVYRILHFKEDSRFHLFMQLNYPNAKDALLGLQKKTINQDEFSQIISSLKRQTIPNQETELGGAIGIHGIGEQTEDRLILHKDENWTKGCIAIKNEEIEELRTFVKIGTPVVIFD
ncbi:MAG: murein L,D-transpeptidase family protein [Gammaproteobacteria bacterium]